MYVRWVVAGAFGDERCQQVGPDADAWPFVLHGQCAERREAVHLAVLGQVAVQLGQCSVGGKACREVRQQPPQQRPRQVALILTVFVILVARSGKALKFS